MPKTQFHYKLEDIIANRIHLAKCKVGDKLHGELWQALDSKKIAEDSMAEIVEMLEHWLYIPCCHTSGMHDPEHFAKRKYICNDQKAESLTRFCKDLGINPVVRSSMDCCWCRDYPHYRKGEGLKLFEEKREQA